MTLEQLGEVGERAGRDEHARRRVAQQVDRAAR
jgi:hypothetical protein